MKRTIVLTLILQFITASALGQTAPNRYEVEILANPNAGRKDTREVNAVLIFEKDGIIQFWILDFGFWIGREVRIQNENPIPFSLYG
jgi:hypothetical protein